MNTVAQIPLVLPQTGLPAPSTIASRVGPPAIGVWGLVKLGFGITAAASGHLIFGGLLTIYGAGALAGAVAWSATRSPLRSGAG